MRKWIPSLLIVAVLFAGGLLFTAGSVAQVNVSNFSNLRTDGYMRADTYLRSGTYAQIGTYAQVGTWLYMTPVDVITFTSGTLTPNGTNQKIAITAGRAITTIAAPDIDGAQLDITNISNQSLTFTETVGNLTLGGTTRVLGQYDRLKLKWDDTLAVWLEDGFINN